MRFRVPKTKKQTKREEKEEEEQFLEQDASEKNTQSLPATDQFSF